MSTAFEEALRAATSAKPEGAESQGSGGSFGLPSYMVASDSLNTANENGTFLEGATEFVESIPKFIGTSLISGANQIYTTPASVLNIFGADIATRDTQDIISELDSDYGKFYSEHRESADLVGFMASSLIPGTAGVKVLRAGQTALKGAMNAGKFGTGTGRALGLLVPSKEKYLAKAVKEATTNSAAANLRNANALKSIAAGIHQGALEALAFETAVSATMFNSPILENQDLGDFVTNVAWGAGLFGIVGGAVDAAKISSTLKKTANAATQEARPWTFIPEPAAASKSYEKLALDAQVLDDIPAVPSGLDEARTVQLTQAAATTRTKVQQRMRSEMGTLANGDEEVAQVFYDNFRSAGAETKQGAFIGMEEVGRLTTPPTGPAAKKAAASAKKVRSGKTTLDEALNAEPSPVVTRFVKSWGEDAGAMFDDSPIVTSIVDTVKKGEKIEVTTKGVKAGKRKWAFDTGYNLGKKAGQTGKKAANVFDSAKAKPLASNARYMWAANLDTFTPTAKAPLTVHVNDIPLMEKVLLDVAEEDMQHVKFTGLGKNEAVGPDLKQFLGDKKVEIANKRLLDEGEKLSQDHIAAVVNVKSSLLSGELKASTTGSYDLTDILAHQDHADKYTSMLEKQGTWNRDRKGLVDIFKVPQHAKVTYDTSPFAGLDNHVLENMAVIKEQQKIYAQGTNNAAAGVLAEDFGRFEDMTSGRVKAGAAPSGAGGSYITAASSNYGTLAGSVENIGRTTGSVIQKFQDRTKEVLEPLLYRLAANQEAAIEWSTLNARVRGIEGDYVLNTAGDALEPAAMNRWRAMAKAATEAGEPVPKMPELNPNMERSIPLRNQEVRDLAKAHIETNGERTSHLASLYTSKGLQFNRGADVFYPIPVNPQDFPHFAMVIDRSITSGNHSKTLFANSAGELEGMMRKLKQNPQLEILTKNEAEAYYKSIGEWDYEKTLNSNYLDTAAHRVGVSSPHLVATDPAKITGDMIDWHMKRETGLVREAVSTKYEIQFSELDRLGEEFTNIGTSQFTDINLLRYAGDAVKNPYRDYIKTALAVKKTADYPIHTQLNTLVDKKFSQMYNKVDELFNGSKSDADLTAINRSLEQSGYKGAAYDTEMNIFANATAEKGKLTSLVQKANSLMATVVLRWDALNAVNNAVSANVLLGAETKAVIRAISGGDKEAVGALAALTNITVPGTGKSIFSARKLVANSIAKFNRNGDDFAFYRDNGFMSSISSQYKEILDDIAYEGTGAGVWSNKLKSAEAKMRKWGDKGEAFTGNTIAEEFNRFVAADVMKQLTDVAVGKNLMTTKEQLAYINTFVNRTQGNYFAAQRPMMFHGAVGQAVGLFQTYQFNLMQQLLRHVGEGHSKDAMTLLGLQGTIHGMNGLPAFQAVNTHLLGNASGNSEHRDAYSEVYGAVGKEAGDWLMYGMASNMLLHPDLKINLYTRGDINPRHVTIVPTNPSSVPIIQATGKVFANMFDVAQKLSAGGDVTTTLLQGLEHNGLSRPLAGIAQVLEGATNPNQSSYSTSKRGNVIAANDLFTLANLGRMAGGKPLDEAIAIDSAYRMAGYQSKDTARRSVLGEAIKSTMIAGQDPTQEQIEDFAYQYAKIGGRSEQFNQWMSGLYKTANMSQTNKLQQSLTSPFTQSMQKIMGGAELRDFSQDVEAKQGFYKAGVSPVQGE